MLKRTSRFRALASALLAWFLCSCAGGTTSMRLPVSGARPASSPVEVTLVDGRALVLANHSAAGDSLIGYVGGERGQEPARVALGWDQIRRVERVGTPVSIASAALLGVALAVALYMVLVKIAYSGAHS